jgi:hypothetical protein
VTLRQEANESFVLERAPPEIAATQWTVTFGASPLLYSDASLRLLGQAIAARRLVLLSVEGNGTRSRLRSSLAVDGQVAANVERTCAATEVERDVPKLVRDLLVSAKILEKERPVYKRAGFWVAISLVAAAVAATAIGIAYRPIHTEVRF